MADLRPREIVHVDLAAGLPDLPPADGRPLFLVAWHGDRVLGYGDVTPPATRAELATRLAELAAPAVGDRLLGPAEVPEQDRLLAADRPLRALEAAGGAASPPVTVTLAVCTRDRPDDLERCLRSVAAARDAPEEILVVDNAPAPGAARAVVERVGGARYVAEPRPGLSAARNAAIRAASCDVLAFVDDDCVVHPGWLGPLRGGFADARVMAVTGLVLPADLGTEAQVAFQLGMGGLGYGTRRARFDGGFLAGRGAAPVWTIGAGANMAVRRAAFDLVGDFDERLGAGAAGCSEDSELWYRLLADGWVCGYEPDSVVFHRHRVDGDALARQLHDYLRGHVAALFVQFARHRHAGNLRRAFVTLPAWCARRGARRLARRALAGARLAAPPGFDTVGQETRGYVRGLAYAPLAAEPQRPRHKAPRGEFLARNPFVHPYTLGFFYREKMRAIHRIAPDLPAARVLEVGGGQSGMARLLYPGAAVTVADIDPSLADAAVNQDPRIEFVVADATDLPFEDGAFDVVTLFDVLEHVPDDRRAASEALRVVRPGGFVLVTTPGPRWRYPYFPALTPVCPPEQELFEEWGHVRRGYGLSELTALFGMEPVRRTGFITRPTALCHDLAWSRLPEPVKRALCTAIGPLTWTGYALQGMDRPGTEIAAAWHRPWA